MYAMIYTLFFVGFFFLFSNCCVSVSPYALGAKNGFTNSSFFQVMVSFPHSSHISFDNIFLVHIDMGRSEKKMKLVFNL